MMLIWKHKDLNKMRRFLVVVAGMMEKDVAELFKYENSGYKIMAIYAVRKCFDFTDKQLAVFFQIYEGYMLNQLEEFSVNILLDAELKTIPDQAIKMHKELEGAYRDYGIKT
jgi:hypothetical protein